MLSQNFSNIRSKQFQIISDTTFLDTLSIVPGSIQLISDDSIPEYLISYPDAYLVFDQPFRGSLAAHYRVFPIKLDSKINHRNKDQEYIQYTYNPYLLTPQSGGNFQDDLFNEQSLDKRGSISRGLNFGNTRDLSISSNMNLQLAGKIQDVEIAAVITDNNIPIQPEGNTQQLQDFDQVFVQFSKDRHQLIAGDFRIDEQESEFMRYKKKAQGLNYQGRFKVNDKVETGVQLGAALSRGKFGRNVLNGTEGNQGPYQLTGAENERFIIVLSGTERVYVDGELMKRGMDNEYVIDYNTGEVTFTNNLLVTKDKRIIVEFQYTDKNYARTLFAFSNDYEIGKKTKVNFKVYSEQDMKFQQLLQTLSDQDIQKLSDAGDSLNQAINTKIDSVAFSADLVLYQKKDSLINGDLYTIYEYSTDPSLAFYQLSFSSVGANTGNYIQTNTTVNGRVFQFIAPVNGIPQGNYEPVIQLISPKKQQMASLAVEHQVNTKQKVFIEGAVSNKNQNTFSNKDKADDQGTALKVLHTAAIPIGNPNQKLELITAQQYRLVSKNFSAIERFREVEFERNWNATADNIGFNEHFISNTLGLAIKGREAIKVSTSFIDRGANFKGNKHDLDGDLKLWKGATLKGNASYLNGLGTSTSSTFLRHKISLNQNLKYLDIKLWEHQEEKRIKLIGLDSLQKTFSNDNFRIYGSDLTTSSKYDIKLGLGYNKRFDFLPKKDFLKLASTADEYKVSIIHENKPGTSYLKITSSFRELNIVDSTLIANKNESTLLNRLEYNFSLWKGLVSSKSFFEIGTGNELKREYTYVAVNPGQGLYTWNDYNNDGIQQLNEFELTDYDDQKIYVRVYLTSNEYIRTFTNQLTQSLNITPSKYIKRDNRFGKFVTRFNDQAYLRLSQKNAKEDGALLSLPFQNGIGDSTLISVNSNLRNTLYFNRSNPIFGLSYTYAESKNKSFLLHGFEARTLLSHLVNFRLNFLKVFTLQLDLEQQEKIRLSEVFSNDDYLINANILSPKLYFQKNSNFRIGVSMDYKDKRNEQIYGGEHTIFIKTGAEITYAVPSKGRWNVNFNYIKANYSGIETNSSALKFDMLEGLQVGANYVWSIRYQQTFKNNLQAGITYDGRSSPGYKVVHTGGMQVQLLF